MAAKLAGPAGGGDYTVEANHDINVTPFVDVMLVLLIIFMVAAPLASVTVKLTLPPAVAKATNNPPKPVYISIQRSGKLYIGDYPTTIPDLGEDLTRAIGRRDPERERIFIRADQDARYGSFMEVMNMLQDNGFYSVALIGLDANRPAGES
jgi:TonB system transport protein ExbD (group 1)